jgi:ADP-glucose pyrophosphorylase
MKVIEDYNQIVNCNIDYNIVNSEVFKYFVDKYTYRGILVKEMSLQSQYETFTCLNADQRGKLFDFYYKWGHSK